MEDFSRDCLRIGCLRAFLHFSLTLRGREELVVTVRTQVPDLVCCAGRKRASTLTALQAAAHDDADFAAPTPILPPSSTTTPKKVAGGGGGASRGESCPPASPAFTEQMAASRDEVIYLIGGYARYDRP